MQARLQSLLGEDAFRVDSAGFERKSLGRHHVHPSAVACMHKRGLDISKHESRYIGKLQHLERYSVFVCVTHDVAQQVRELLAGIEHDALVLIANDEHGISDPHEAIESVETCAKLIDDVLLGIADQIRAYAAIPSRR